ncbi:MAG: pyridoxamine 5'-phosphate oxidase family protein [Planctomycetaceae bacterium]|nr:pyridoxamine 5'-phosphate oxidase family protein [Planctomycetaceae bacterium]
MPDPSTVPTLAEIWEQIWEQLSVACDRVNHPWGCAVLSNCTEDGPAARTVVLRRLSRLERWLFAHTDRRSPKVSQLQRFPKAVWTFYDSTSREQLVVASTIQVLTSGEQFERCWHESRPESLHCYLGPYAPGTIASQAESNMPQGLPWLAQSPEQLQMGRDNFAALHATIYAIDWLRLSSGGNLRAHWDWQGDDWVGHWRAP